MFKQIVAIQGSEPVDPEFLQRRINRRGLFSLTGGGAVPMGAAGLSLPALLAACGRDEPVLAPRTAPSPTGEPSGGGEVLVGDVLDFALVSDEWEGSFGFVTFRLHRASVEGQDVYVIRTDSSDEGFAQSEALVWAPKLGGLAGMELTEEAFLVLVHRRRHLAPADGRGHGGGALARPGTEPRSGRHREDERVHERDRGPGPMGSSTRCSTPGPESRRGARTGTT